MNSKTILIGGLAAVALIAVGWMLGGDPNERTQEPEKGLLFPNFDPNDAGAIEISTQTGSYRLDRDGETWGFAEKGGYPVDLGKLRALMLSIDGAEIVDVKTDDPALHDRLGLESTPPNEDDHWRKLEIQDDSGNPLASLILGKRPGGGRTGQTYARRTGEDQCWLIELQNMGLPADGTEWISKEIFKVSRERVRAARVSHANGEVVTVAKNDASDKHYRFLELGERKLRYESAPDGFGSALEYLKLEDVARDGTVDLGDAAPTEVSLWTWDGIRIDVTITPKDDVHWASFRATADPDGAPEPPDDIVGPSPDEASGSDVVAEAEVTPETRQADIDELNAKVEGWLFQLPAYNVTSLSKRAADLVEQPKPKDDESGDTEFLTPGSGDAGAQAPADDTEKAAVPAEDDEESADSATDEVEEVVEDETP